MDRRTLGFFADISDQAFTIITAGWSFYSTTNAQKELVQGHSVHLTLLYPMGYHGRPCFLISGILDDREDMFRIWPMRSAAAMQHEPGEILREAIVEWAAKPFNLGEDQ